MTWLPNATLIKHTCYARLDLVVANRPKLHSTNEARSIQYNAYVYAYGNSLFTRRLETHGLALAEYLIQL